MSSITTADNVDYDAGCNRHLRLPEELQRLQAILTERVGADREIVEFRRLGLHRDEQAVRPAVEFALESGAGPSSTC